MTKEIAPGKKYFTYSADEVIWFRDSDHTPHNKRSGEVESVLMVEIRKPLNVDWVAFSAMENTTTKNRETGNKTTREKAIWFTMSREQFNEIAAHVNREK